MMSVKGYCPACGHQSLFVGAGGHITCSSLECPNPSAVDTILEDRETHHVVTFTEDGWTVRHPLVERVGDELLDCWATKLLQSLSGPPPMLGRYRLRRTGPDAADIHWELIG